MGMYDTVTIRDVRVSKKFRDKPIQFKDLHCDLNEYLIDESGRVLLTADTRNGDGVEYVDPPEHATGLNGTIFLQYDKVSCSLLIVNGMLASVFTSSE